LEASSGKSIQCLIQPDVQPISEKKEARNGWSVAPAPEAFEILQLRIKEGAIGCLVETEQVIRWVSKDDLMKEHGRELVIFYEGKVLSQHQRQHRQPQLEP
jgi:ABC-type xylose transport system substrate-binding protein